MPERVLATWIDAWADRYDHAYDAPLEALAGLAELSPGHLDQLMQWKLRGLWSKKHIRELGREPEGRVIELTRRAFACNDDLGALLILADLRGVGAAVASAILTAHDQIRYTVMDRRAIKSLRSLGELPHVGSTATSRMWLPYLTACRQLSDRIHRPLRTIDRALYEAAGSPNLPL
jgi:hypothetical protein